MLALVSRSDASKRRVAQLSQLCERTHVMASPILDVRGFVKRYGTKVAAHGYSLAVEPGSILGLVGPNGAGKTTLIKAMVGVQDFDEGSIAICGHDVVKDPIAAKTHLAYVPDTPWVYGFMTGMAYLEFVCDIFGVDSARRRSVIQELAERLEMVDALADRADSYSHGMLQKLVVMGALVHDPDFLVLDEPFVGLDPVATRTLRTVLQERAAQGKAVLFSSHVLEVVERLCDSVAIIQAGQLRAFGPIDQVLGDESLEDVFMDVVETHEATAAPAAPVRPSDAPQTPFS